MSVTYIHTDIHTCIIACIHTYVRMYIYTYIHASMRPCINACIPAYRHTSIHALRYHRHTCIYGHALRGPPFPPPLHGLWSRMPPLLWDGVWVPLPPGVVVGVLGFWVKRYKASSRQGLREGLGCRFVGVDSLCLV